MFPKDTAVTKVHRKLLWSINDFSTLGYGFRIEIPGNWCATSTGYVSPSSGVSLIQDDPYPNWSDMVYPFWSDCYVSASKIRWKFITTREQGGAGPYNIFKTAGYAGRVTFGSFVSSVYEDVCNQNGSKKAYTYNNGTRNYLSMTTYGTTKKAWGITNKYNSDNKDFVGPTSSVGSGQPTNGWYHTFVASTMDTNPYYNTPMYVEANVTYYVVLKKMNKVLDP